MNAPVSEVRTEHLSEMELDEVLIGGLDDLPLDAWQHFNACEHCQAEHAALSDPISGFNAVTLAWSERQASTMPLRPPVEQVEAAAQPRWQRLLAPRNLAYAGTAATVLVVGLLSMPRHRDPGGAIPLTAVHSLPAATEFSPGRAARIAHDNRMLNEINRVLEASDDAPVVDTGFEPARPPQGAGSRNGVTD